jgi:aminoglycoside phosphotransferase (APT) family kinase protein
MHADEFEIDADLVRRLLEEQFPQWADRDLRRVESSGTDNAIFRVGDDLAARLPRIERAADQVDKEHVWLPRLAPRLPLDVPVPVARGTPADGFPWSWSVTPWFEGETASEARLPDLRRAALDLAGFLRALERVDPSEGPPPGDHNFGRGVPLRERDEDTRAAIAALDGVVDVSAVTAAWDEALRAPEWDGPLVWIHGDLAEGNLVVRDGRLVAVIDFGGLAVGDPACDLMIAWTLFSGESREAFRAELSIDDAMWARGRGWALSWALVFIPYYLETNPVGVHAALETIDRVLATA